MTQTDIIGIVYSVKKTPEEIEHTLKRLREPFDEALIKWKPQTISSGKNGSGKRGQAAAYADPRAYSDRLNEVCGVNGWFELSNVTCSVPFPRKVSRRGEAESFLDFVKMTATVSVGIIGLGFHTNVGESWADDENAYTSSYAQAFKRACYNFGLGRYLYDLPKQWHPVDDWGKWTGNGPQLPDWAKPRQLCTGCADPVIEAESGGKKFTVARLVEHSRGKYGRIMCAGCMSALQRQQSEAAAAAA